MSIKLLHALCDKFTPFFINGNEILFNEGDPADALYLVLYGRLRILQGNDKNLHVIGEIGQGELVGEFALIAQQNRFATIMAMRDTQLLALSAKDFYEFLHSHPLEIEPLMRSALVRSINREESSLDYYGNSPIATIAIIPRSSSPDVKKAINAFYTELADRASTLHVTEKSIMEILDIDQNFEDVERQIAARLAIQELNYRYLVYETSYHYTAWTKFCLRQADVIVVIADHNEEPGLTDLEKQLYAEITEKSIHLVLIHQSNTSGPTRTYLWTSLRKNVRWHHYRKGNKKDIERVCRLINGNSIALVLAAGGSLGYGHLGVLKAFNELGISIDAVGGTSAGACMGALCAMDIPIEEMAMRIKEVLVANATKIKDYTLPLLSLFKGFHLEKILQEIFGKTTMIEDLWIDFFAVACNVNHSCIEIIDSGSLWKALRASSALPGIFPPSVNDKGTILVDGGVLNMLPVDIMRQRIGSGKIIATGFEKEDDLQLHPFEGGISGWSLLGRKLRRSKKNFSSIGEIINRCFLTASQRYALELIPQANVFIEIERSGTTFLNFKAFDRMLEAGYVAAMHNADKLLSLTSDFGQKR